MEPPAAVDGTAWHTKRFLVVFYSLTALAGIVAPDENSDLEFVFAVGLGFTMAWWAITDASDRGRPIRPALRLLVMAIGWLAVPIYLVWTRRLRGVGWLLLNAVAYVLVASGGSLLGHYARGR